MSKTAVKSELLMPAGSLEKMKTAILYGADAVYCGTPDLSMRTKSSFTLEELLEGIAFAHERGVRVYLTLNLYAHNADIPKLDTYLTTLRQAKPDGVIIADPGVFQYVKDHAPEIPLHISTQANVTSWLSVDYWHKQGAELVVLAREVSYEELAEIREKCPDVKLEQFIHGAMCMTYSGRCLLSNYLAERGANQGSCAHSCRWKYKFHVRLKDNTLHEIEINEHTKELFEFLMEEEFRPGEMIPIEEDMRGSYILNSKDLCLMPKLPELLELGIESLKVEGRNKSTYYAAVVARAYRMAIDDYRKDPENWDPKPYMQELHTLQNRGYTLAFHEGRLTNLAHDYVHGRSGAHWEYAGAVREWDGDDLIFEIKNFILPGELIEFLSPKLREPVRVRLQEFEDAKTGKITEKVNPGQGKAIRIPTSFFNALEGHHLQEILPIMTVARKKKTLSLLEHQHLMLKNQSLQAEIQNLPVDPVRKAKLLKDMQEQETYLQSIKPAKKGPRMGLEGCCGKGCNGCLVFWKDPKYTAKREQLLAKGLGKGLLLTAEEARV